MIGLIGIMQNMITNGLSPDGSKRCKDQLQLLATTRYKNYMSWKSLAASFCFFLIDPNSDLVQVLRSVLGVENMPTNAAAAETNDRPVFESVKVLQTWISSMKADKSAVDETISRIAYNPSKTLEDIMATLKLKESSIALQNEIIAGIELLRTLERLMSQINAFESKILEPPFEDPGVTSLMSSLTVLKGQMGESFMQSMYDRCTTIQQIADVIQVSQTNQENSSSSDVPSKSPLVRLVSTYAIIEEHMRRLKEGSNGTMMSQLKSKIDDLNSIQKISQWSDEAISGMKTILTTDITNLIDDKEGIMQEALNWKTQATSRQLQLEEINMDPNVMEFISQQLNNVIRLTLEVNKLMEQERTNMKQQQIEAFERKEEKIATNLQNILIALQGIKIEGNCLSAIEKASQNVENILHDCEKLEKEKNDYVDLGSKIKAFHSGFDSIKDICLKWERVTNLLRDQKFKSQSLIELWNQSEALKKSFESELETLSLKFPEECVIEDHKRFTALHDDYKASLDTLRKMRHQFEKFFKCQKQLIHEMQTVPLFDANNLKAELSDIQQRYTKLCTTQKEKLFLLDKIITNWDSLQKGITQIEGKITESKTLTDSKLSTIAEQISHNGINAQTHVESLKRDMALLGGVKLNFLVYKIQIVQGVITESKSLSENQPLIKTFLTSTSTLEEKFATFEEKIKSGGQSTAICEQVKVCFEQLMAFKIEWQKPEFSLLNKNVVATVAKLSARATHLLSAFKAQEKQSIEHFMSTEVENYNIALQLTTFKSFLQMQQDTKDSLLKIISEQLGQEMLKGVLQEENSISAVLLSKFQTIEEMFEKMNKDSKATVNKLAIFEADVEGANFDLKWKQVFKKLTVILKSLSHNHEEEAKKNSVMQTLDELTKEVTSLSNQLEIKERYSQLSQLAKRVPRNAHDDTAIKDKIQGVFDKIVATVLSDLTSKSEDIPHDWLKSWITSSIEEMHLVNGISDLSQILHDLEQAIVLQYSCNFATDSVSKIQGWTRRFHSCMTDIKTDQLSDASQWAAVLSNIESILNVMFDEIVAHAPPSEEVVILSRLDIMKTEIESSLTKCRNFIAQLRSFQEKLQELSSTVDYISDRANLDLIQYQVEDAIQQMGGLEKTAVDLDLSALLLFPMQQISEINLRLNEKKETIEVIESIETRTDALREMSMKDEEFEDSATSLLQELTDNSLELTNSQNEIVQGCLEEVTTLLEEFEAHSKLTVDLSEVAELHEELTLWLKDVEDALQKSVELKSSYDEKKLQLDEYIEIHNDIDTRGALVGMVFEKTNKLMVQTNDFSLSTYLSSIQGLFESIKTKSSKLIEQMVECIEDHEEYDTRFAQFTDYLTDQAQKLKSVLSQRTLNNHINIDHPVGTLLQNLDRGNGMIMDLEESHLEVCASTSEEGKKTINIEYQQISMMWAKHLKQVQDLHSSVLIQ